MRGLPEGTPRSRPPRFPDWTTRSTTSARFADTVREESGGIPIGFKLSAQHIEDDLDAALDLGVDYVILDGRGGGTGAAPLIFRDTSRCRRSRRSPGPARHLDRRARATSRSWSPAASARARTSPRRSRWAPTRSRSPTRRSRPSAASACGPATPTTARWASPPRSRTCAPGSRSTRPPSGSTRFLGATTELMVVLARACGHDSLSHFTPRRPDQFDRDVADLIGVAYGGVGERPMSASTWHRRRRPSRDDAAA